MTPVIWLACDCYVWPVIPAAMSGRCGLCREYADRPVPAPADGKAHPL